MIRRRLLTILAVLLMFAVGCATDDDTASTGGDDASSSSTTTSAATPTTVLEHDEALRILVVNDDGIEHPGLDLLVRTLEEMDEVEITIVAPGDNQSGTSDQRSEGAVVHEPGQSASGIAGTAVQGFPADAVIVALEELGLEPHLVVSGINDGQNIGPFAALSGTVGAVRTAARNGVPGVAVSAGLEFNEPEFEVGAELVVAWIQEHRGALLAGTMSTDVVVSFNIPTCPPDQMGPVVEVPRALEFPEGHGNPFESDCDLADQDPADDVAALRAGYPARTLVPLDL